jgi:hypothetical protein
MVANEIAPRNPLEMERNPDNAVIPGALLVCVEAALFYFKITYVHDAVWETPLKDKSV